MFTLLLNSYISVQCMPWLKNVKYNLVGNLIVFVKIVTYNSVEIK